MKEPSPTTRLQVTVEIPGADLVPFEAFVRGMAQIMTEGLTKGYSPELSHFIAGMLNDDTGTQYWQACEAVAKTVRGCTKIANSQPGAARQDFLKVACAAYTLTRDFCKSLPELSQEPLPYPQPTTPPEPQPAPDRHTDYRIQ